MAGKAEEYASYVLAEGADVALLENQAAITIGSGARVQGKHVNVTADAQTEAVIGVEAEGKKASQNISALIPSASGELCPGQEYGTGHCGRNADRNWCRYHHDR